VGESLSLMLTGFRIDADFMVRGVDSPIGVVTAHSHSGLGLENCRFVRNFSLVHSSTAWGRANVRAQRAGRRLNVIF